MTFTRSLQSLSNVIKQEDGSFPYCANLELRENLSTGKTVGIDLGVKDVIVLSDGRKLNPDKQAQQKNEKRIKRCQKSTFQKTKR